MTLPGLELRHLGRPAHRQSLYRLRYPGSSEWYRASDKLRLPAGTEETHENSQSGFAGVTVEDRPEHLPNTATITGKACSCYSCWCELGQLSRYRDELPHSV
jgi:hypothetical protein